MTVVQNLNNVQGRGTLLSFSATVSANLNNPRRWATLLSFCRL